MIEISVIVCTYNRAATLEKTLHSWLSVKDAGPGVELIVVDNNSTDHTHQVVSSFRPLCSNRLWYVHEPNVGLSSARNRGIAEASGKIVAFVDDDVDFSEKWLNEMLRAFKENPGISCVGGNSIPKFEAAKPDWLTEDIYKLYGSTASGDQDRLMELPEHPFGLNMAFKKEIFNRIGKFNTALGRIKNSLLSNEESDLFYRIDRAGMKVFYASGAVLYHRIPADRMSQKWVLERSYWQGISNVVLAQIINPSTKLELFLNTLKIFRTIIVFYVKKTLSKIFPFVRAPTFNRQLAVCRSKGIARQNLLEIVPSMKKL